MLIFQGYRVYMICSRIFSILFCGLLIILLLACASAIGVRNPDYSKKIKSLAVLNFTGPGELGMQATDAFGTAVKELNVVSVYMPYQINEFMARQGLKDMDPADPAARKILSDKLNIDAFINGQVVQYNNTYRTAGNLEVIIRLTDISSGEQIYSAAVRTDDAGILSGEEYEIIEASIDAIISDIKSQFDI